MDEKIETSKGRHQAKVKPRQTGTQATCPGRVQQAGGHPPTVSGEELLQVLLRAGIGQVPHEEPPGVSQVLLLFVLPERPALPGFGTILQGRLGRRDIPFPEHFDVASTWAREGR